MPANIIIGVGGTGAKVVEAVLHTSAAGLGPETLSVGFVDQDKSNGNVSRAQETLNKLTSARRGWRTPGAPHQLDGDLLRTDARTLQPGLWVPHPNQQTTLAQILGDVQGDQPLFDLLFAKDRLEQEMRLDEGYRGRAHIGSAAITAAMDEDTDFWRSLLNEVRGAKGGEVVRLMLVGSVFGGTGAAGFPTITRLIRRVLKQEGIEQNISLGGVLMLPYFKFSPPEERGANVARSEDLLPQTRGALRYYNALFKREHVFDELYMVGWNPAFDLGYHQPGTGDQRNPALVPELIAALGVCRFFQPDHTPTDRIVITARSQESAIRWQDVPSPTANPNAPYEKLGQQLRFAAAWKHWEPILARKDRSWQSYQSHAWFKKQGVGSVDFDKHSPGDPIRALSEYLDALIKWAASMEAYAKEQQFEWGLWNTDRLLDGPAAFDAPQDPVQTKSQLSEQEFGAATQTVIPALDATDPPPGAAELHRRLNERTYEGGHEGLGRVVAALHAFSSVHGATGGKG